MKNLEQLGEEYETAAGIVGERIAQRRAKLKLSRPGSREAGILRDEINVLYRERRDVLDTAKKLKNYYGGKGIGCIH